MEVEERERELEKLAAGAREWGLVLVSDHGIPTSLLGEVKDVVKGFFGLSFEEKKACVGTYASVDNLGYGRNYVKSETQILEWMDRLTMMAAPKGCTNGLNVWPQKPANFREVIETYAEEARKVADELLQAVAEALSLEDQNAFLKYFNPNTSEIKVRINYYPPCPTPNTTLGLNPHSDLSALTLLIQFDATGGLQVIHKDHPNNWLTVPWPVDALLVGVGDLLEIMSNGRVKSPWHRAVTQADVERCSLALFYNPDVCVEIEPVKKDDDGEEDEYKKVVVGEYVKHCYKVNPTPTKEAIKFAMV